MKPHGSCSHKTCVITFEALVQNNSVRALPFSSHHALRHSRANAFCLSRLQTRIARTSHQIDQPSHIVNSAAFATSCVRFLSIPDRGPKPREHGPYLGDPRNRITRKNTRFVFTGEVTCSGTVALPYCSHTRIVFANYVVEMMTRLPLDSRP